MKPKLRLWAALCAASCLAFTASATGEVISVNFGNSVANKQGKIGLETEVEAGRWVNAPSGSATGGNPEAVEVVLQDQAQGRYPKAVLKVASRGGTYQNGDQDTSATSAMLHGFLDDSNGSNEACFEVVNVPFSEYTVYIYFNRDNDADYTRAFPSYEVNHKLYYGTGSATSETTTVQNWGTVKKVELADGVNTLKVTGQTASTLRVYASRYCTVDGVTAAGDARGCISGFQIVNTGTSGTVYTAEATGTSVSFGEISWNGGTLSGGPLNTATLTLAPGATLTFTEVVPQLMRLKLVSTGKFSLDASGMTLKEALANVACVEVAGGGELDLGALEADVIAVADNATLTMNAPGQVATVVQSGTVRYAGGEALTLFDIHTAAQNNKTTIIDKTISSVKTSSPTDRNLEGYFAINGSRTIELGENANITVSTRFAMADDDNASPVLNQNGGTITVEGEGIENTTTTGTAVILGHWGGTPAYNLNKGTLSVTKGATGAKGAIMLGWAGNPTMTVGTSDGEAASAKVITKGIVSHGYAGGQGRGGKLVLNPSGVIEVGSLGLDFSNTYKTEAVVELAGGLLKVTDDAPLALANKSGLKLMADTTIDVASGKTLTVSAPFTGTGALTLTGGGTVDLSALGTSLPKIASLAEGTTLRVAPYSQNARLTGNFSASLPLAEGASLAGTIEYLDGEAWKTATVTTDGSTATLSGTITATPTLTGSSWWWDYEFNGSEASTGSDKGVVSLEGSATNYTEADSTGNRALYLHKTPYRDATYPAELTAVMRCQPGDHENTVLIGFGTTYNPGVAIALVTGENPANGDMRLVLILRSGTTVTVTDLVEGGLNVANATTAQHLYAFSIATVADKTQIAVYVDGKRKTLYTHPTTIALGGGFQIGSLYGGVKDNNGTWTTGLAKYPNTSDPGTVDFLRVSTEVLTDAAMRAMAAAYPYVSAKGTATRTVSTATATWEDETGTPWAQVTPSSETAVMQAAPNVGTNVVLSASADTAITLNGTAAVTYESMTVEGSGAVTLSATETSATMLASDLTVSTNLTVPAHRFTAGTVTVDAGKTLTFDCSGLDGWKETYVLTGYVEPEVAERIFVANTEIAGSPFTYEKAQDSAGSIILRATDSTKPLMATVPDGEVNFSALNWTVEGQPSTPDWSKTSALSVTLTLSGNTTLIFDKDSAVAVRELILEGSGTLTLRKATGAAAFSSQTTRVNTSVDMDTGALSLGKVVLGPRVSLTLHESTYDLTKVRAATGVNKETRPTVILASDCTLAVSRGEGSEHHNFNLTIAEGTTCTTSGRWDLCGTTVTVAGTLKKADDFWFGVSYSSLNYADSALVVTPTGKVTQSSGVFYIGGWGNTILNTVSVAGACTLNAVQYHGSSTVGFSVEEGGVLTVKGVAGGSTAAIANVSVKQGGTLAWKDTLSGTLAFEDGAGLDASAGVPAVTGEVSFAGALKVKVAGMPTAASTLVLSKAGLSAGPRASTVWVGEAEAKTLFVAKVDEGLAVKLPQVPAAVTEQAAVEALRAFAAEAGLAEVTALSGQTSDPAAEGGKRTLSDAELNAALACFSGVLTAGESAGAVVVAYDFGVAAVTPVYYAVDGTLLRIDVKVKVQGPEGAAAGIAQGVKLRLVDSAGTLIPDYTMDYTGGAVTEPTFTPVENEAGAYISSYQVGTLLGKQIRVRATNE